jgi:hypothetical protein
MKARGQVGEIADIVEQDPLVIAGERPASRRALVDIP